MTHNKATQRDPVPNWDVKDRNVPPHMTHNTREVEEWEVIKTDIHSPFLVMLHSTLINQSVYKTSGEMAQAVIKVFEEYAAPSLLHHQLQKAREDLLRDILSHEFTDSWNCKAVYVDTIKRLFKESAELDQDKKYFMGVDFAKNDPSELDQEK